MTDTRPAPEATDAAPAVAAADAPGIAGWVSTSDHRRIGRLFIGVSVVGLLVAVVTGLLLEAEGLDGGLDILKDGSFEQVFTAHREAWLLLGLVPLLLGVATAVVPAQVGSVEIAFPRGSAAAFWGYVVSFGLLVGGYAADGGPTGGEEVGRDIYLLALAGLAVSLCVGLVSVLTTILAMRAPGMTLLRTPTFAWSILVWGGLLLLSLPVLAARVAHLYVTNHHGGDIAERGLASVDWVWSIPTVYVFAVPLAGVALEVIQVLAKRPLRLHAAGLALIGLLGIAGIGAWAQDAERFDEVVYVGMALLAIVPALALLGLVGDTARAGSPRVAAPLVLSVLGLVLLLLGALAGAAQSIDALELQGTTWETGQLALVGGAATLGGIAALWWWAPRLFGSLLGGGAGILTGLLLFAGFLVAAVPNLVEGLSEDTPELATEFEDEDLSGVLNGVSTAGEAIVAVGGLLVVLQLLGAARRGEVEADADPWGGHTLEWSSSPVVPVTSPTPLLRTEGEVTA